MPVIKAFDRIDHKTLFQKLIDRNTPQCLIGIIHNWYHKLTGASLWDRFNKTVMKRFEAAYVKCVKVFFGFARLDSVASMFSEL